MAATFRQNGAQYITETIDAAVKNGSRTATIRGCWDIDTAIRIPGDFTLILDGCHLRMADGCYANLFVNEHHDTDIGRTKAGTDRNITILGRNGAVLDGGNYNLLSEKTQLQNGLPPIWKNNLLLFTNVDGFTISGISVRHQRWWALNFLFCAHGRITDIDFCSCDIGIDAMGNAYHGLKHAKYAEVLVKNADGIDLRQGCHDIVIDKITGFTEDDTIALTGLNGKLEQTFAVDGLSTDICHISIQNVIASAFCTMVRLLNQGDVALHDIVIDTVHDTSAQSPYMDRGLYAVRIGDTHLYGTRQATADETYNIAIRNVRSRGAYAVSLVGNMKNVTWENIECFDGAQLIEDKRGSR